MGEAVTRNSFNNVVDLDVGLYSVLEIGVHPPSSNTTNMRQDPPKLRYISSKLHDVKS